MSDDSTHERSALHLDVGTSLAFQRTFLAHERTQMAWIRTALAFISFGFGIAKFFEYLHENQGWRAPLLSPRAVGILMIAIGLVALALAALQHWRAVVLLRAQSPDLPASLAGITAAFLGLLGFLALAGAILR